MQIFINLMIFHMSRIINNQVAAYPEGGLVGLFLRSSGGAPLKSTFADWRLLSNIMNSMLIDYSFLISNCCCMSKSSKNFAEC